MPKPRKIIVEIVGDDADRFSAIYAATVKYEIDNGRPKPTPDAAMATIIQEFHKLLFDRAAELIADTIDADQVKIGETVRAQIESDRRGGKLDS